MTNEENSWYSNNAKHEFSTNDLLSLYKLDFPIKKMS